MLVVFTCLLYLFSKSTTEMGEERVDSYSTPGTDPLKRASFGILRDLPSSLFLAKMTFSFPFTIQCKHSTDCYRESTRTQPNLCFMKSYNLHFMCELEGSGCIEGTEKK